MFLSSLDDRIRNANNVLLMGIGGGFDFVQGVPIYEKLCELKKMLLGQIYHSLV
jgi:hypothetical protein